MLINTSSENERIEIIKAKIEKLRRLKKEMYQEEAEIYLLLADMCKDGERNNDINLKKSYKSLMLSNTDILKIAEIEKDASQLIKIKDIYNHVSLGWPMLVYIRKHKPKMDRFDFDEAKKNFGDLHDHVNLESYIISRIFQKNQISIPNDKIKENCRTGLEADFLENKNNIEKIKLSNNQTMTLFWMRHNAVENKAKAKVDKVRNSDAEITKMYNKLKKIIEEKVAELGIKNISDVKEIVGKKIYIDEAKVHDLSLITNKLLALIQITNDGNYEYGVYSEQDQKELDYLINEMLIEI